MTFKQKIALGAAQYAARALTMTRHADVLVEVAEEIDEDRAKSVYEALERFGMVDHEGLLKSGDSAKTGDLLSKAGLS